MLGAVSYTHLIGSASLKRLDYTVIGDCVNTAQRLQSAAKANQIVISEEVFEKAKESFKCEKIGEVLSLIHIYC